MEKDQIRKVKEAKESIDGLKEVALLEVLLYIDEKLKIYETRRRV